MSRGDAVIVICVYILGAMVWVAPTFPGLEADHVCLGEMCFEFRPILVFGGERLIF